MFPYDFRERVNKQNGMKMEIMGSERALLGFLLAKIHKVDPDVIVVSYTIALYRKIVYCICISKCPCGTLLADCLIYALFYYHYILKS